MKVYYDLHIHSCLSPCGDDDATPAVIAGIAKLNGLDMAALTDHNTCKNCPAFFTACEFYGVTPVAGMELTTAEDVHIVCLFPTLEKAMEFDGIVEGRSAPIKNKPVIFGNQKGVMSGFAPEIKLTIFLCHFANRTKKSRLLRIFRKCLFLSQLFNFIYSVFIF